MTLEAKIEDLLREIKEIKSEIREINFNKSLNEIIICLSIIMISAVVVIHMF